LFVCGVLLSSLAVRGQTNVAAGFTWHLATGATSRGPAGPVQLLFRFAAEDYRGYGNAQATSVSGNDVTGIQFTLQDQFALAGSQEQYDVRVYGESPQNHGFPAFAANQPAGTNELAHLGPFTSPVGGTASDPRGAWIVTVTFATPLTLPAAQDVFVGVQLQQAAAMNLAAVPSSWPNDGLSVHTSVGAGTSASVFDDKGPALIEGNLTNGSYLLVHDLAAGTYAYSGGPHQGQVDFLVPSAIGRGVVTAVTNQTSYPISNTAPGTSSFFSALHPDARAVPLHAGRADNVGYAFLGAPAGAPVFTLAGFSFAAAPQPLAAILPGSTGSACLDSAGAMVVQFALGGGTGVDAWSLPLSPGARTIVAGVTLVFQAIELDPATGLAHAGPCGATRL
jgi:hypothetical protein